MSTDYLETKNAGTKHLILLYALLNLLIFGMLHRNNAKSFDDWMQRRVNYIAYRSIRTRRKIVEDVDCECMYICMCVCSYIGW